MTPGEIIALLQAAANLTSMIVDLVQKTKATLSSEDIAAIDAALADLQAKNDADWARISTLIPAP